MPTADLEPLFVAARKKWGGNGSGSTFFSTIAIRTALPTLLDELKIESILDLGCGTLSWFDKLAYKFDYVGVDVVSDVIAQNRKAHPRLRFEVLAAELPQTDLILCRDCFAHLTLETVHDMITRIVSSESKWLLTSTYPHSKYNGELHKAGDYRPINLTLPPFSFPPEHRLICDDRQLDKHLGLWKIADLSQSG